MMSFALSDRIAVPVEDVPSHMRDRYLGISLTNEEAQSYLARGLPVKGDDGGPYLIGSLPAPSLVKPDSWAGATVSVKVVVLPWEFYGRAGFKCWLVKINRQDDAAQNEGYLLPDSAVVDIGQSLELAPWQIDRLTYILDNVRRYSTDKV